MTKKNEPLLLNTVSAIVCGPSNCGKTTCLISLLLSPNGLRFKNIYIYSKSLNQPKYVYLAKVVSKIKEIAYFPHSNNTDILKPEEAKTDSVFIFDDIACEKQNEVREYFSMERHNIIDIFYLR